MNILGKGAFGEVWLCQAYQISQLRPRDKSNDAQIKRRKLLETKNVGKHIEKEMERGTKIELVAVKKIIGKQLEKRVQ